MGFSGLTHRIQTGPGVHLSSYPMRTRGSYNGGKTAGADEVKNEWCCTSIPAIRLHDVVYS
jgi:hypothetical protein